MPASGGSPPADLPTHTLAPRAPSAIGLVPGDQVGPYRLLEIIGEGGFGVVYLAERREPMVQRVALKVIKPGMDSKAVVARFEQERQALAVMDHPNVSRVFDGGVTDRGLPYFVMEHVAGEPITTFCDRHRYTIRQRLELFIPVCEAVQHAHHKGIIHRDIKPSNILVSLKDEKAIPKVIDFGVAKAVSHTMTEKTIFTEAGQLIGTPEYMSPEQAEMGVVDIDTRTDVYSLGVVLYELLTGLLPFDSMTLRARGFAELQQIIRNEDTPTPSTRLSDCAEGAAADIARSRQATREKLQRELRHELEWIPMMAMRKDRSRRYATALDLMEDIRRWRRSEPLLAGPEDPWYRVRKFITKHRRAVAATGGVAVVLLASSVLIAAFWLQADRARRNAERMRDTTLQLVDQLAQQMSEYDAHRQRLEADTISSNLAMYRNDVNVHAALQAARKRISEIQGDPAIAHLAAQFPSLIPDDTEVTAARSSLARDPSAVNIEQLAQVLTRRAQYFLSLGDRDAALADFVEVRSLRQNWLRKEWWGNLGSGEPLKPP